MEMLALPMLALLVPTSATRLFLFDKDEAIEVHNKE